MQVKKESGAMVGDLADSMPNGTEVLVSEQGDVQVTAHGGKQEMEKCPFKMAWWPCLWICLFSHTVVATEDCKASTDAGCIPNLNMHSFAAKTWKVLLTSQEGLAVNCMCKTGRKGVADNSDARF